MLPRRSQRNLERANRTTILHTFVNVVSGGEEDSEKDELIIEDPPSPGPSVPNGKFVILLVARFFIEIIIQTNHQVSKYFTDYMLHL